MFTARRLTALLFATTLFAALGCHAQTPAVPAGTPLSPEQARRVEVLVRQRAELPPGSVVAVGPRTPSDLAGYDTVEVTVTNEGRTSHPIKFLLSKDGKTLAQFTKFDISANPRDLISPEGRPSRGGPATAPVLIVGFDDLECPFCAQMNALLFPAVLERYKSQVRIVYRDFPLEELHPWAKHAAVDANCLASASSAGYWNFVDYVHAHSAEMPGPEKSLEKANQNLDKIALDEGLRDKVDQSALVACVLKQDDSGVKASILLGEADPLRLNQAPVIYINGEKVEGVVPIETLYRIIDRALIAAGQTPPPAPPAPAPQAAKPGS